MTGYLVAAALFAGGFVIGLYFGLRTREALDEEWCE